MLKSVKQKLNKLQQEFVKTQDARGYYYQALKVADKYGLDPYMHMPMRNLSEVLTALSNLNKDTYFDLHMRYYNDPGTICKFGKTTYFTNLTQRLLSEVDKRIVIGNYCEFNPILLNAIWLLNHDDVYFRTTNPEPHASKVQLKWNGCKITSYADETTEIEFPNQEMYDAFRYEFDEALKRLPDLEKQRIANVYYYSHGKLYKTYSDLKTDLKEGDTNFKRCYSYLPFNDALSYFNYRIEKWKDTQPMSNVYNMAYEAAQNGLGYPDTDAHYPMVQPEDIRLTNRYLEASGVEY